MKENIINNKLLLLNFVMLYNFDFINYNENNKYSLWKFVQLLLCYIVIFIGVGGSSLLSQTIFFELFKKYKQWEKGTIKDDDNIIKGLFS